MIKQETTSQLQIMKDQMKKGMLTIAVLQAIKSERVFAGDILKRLADTEFSTSEGTLYPLLSRLKRQGMLEYEWVESEAGPPRKYYKLSDAGEDLRKALLQAHISVAMELKSLGVKK